MSQKQCAFCGKKIYGRSDKKYCDHLCRSSYHNQLLSDSQKQYRKTHQLLQRNHAILKSFSEPKVSKTALDERGFLFGYCSRVLHENGKTIYFCYDIGYVQSENNYFAVISKETIGNEGTAG